MLSTTVSIETIIKFLSSNIVAIITIIITIAGIVGTPIYIKNKIKSAREERYDQAKNNLLTILENRVINNREMSESTIETLRAATERKYEVSIADRLSTREMLQDVQLRIEQSKLDVEDKDEYSEKIESRIQEIKEEEQTEDLPIEYQKVLENLSGMEQITEEEIVDEIEKARAERNISEVKVSFSDIISVVLAPGQSSELPEETQRTIHRVVIISTIVYVIILILFF